MHQLDCDRALTHARSHALDGSMPDVAHRENTRDARLEQKRIAVESPAFGALSLPDQLRTCQDESAVIALHKSAQPVRTGRRPDEDEQAIGRNTIHRSGTA